jgi:hypothetical protein
VKLPRPVVIFRKLDNERRLLVFAVRSILFEFDIEFKFVGVETMGSKSRLSNDLLFFIAIAIPHIPLA